MPDTKDTSTRASIKYSRLGVHATTPRRNYCIVCCLIVLVIVGIVSIFARGYVDNLEIAKVRQIAFELEGYQRRPEVTNLQCDRLFDGDILYAKGMPRRTLIPTPQDRLDMSCWAVKKRVSSRRNLPTGFPVAFAKVVYTDYEFLEEQLAVSYSEENTFCFALDKNATLDFRRNFAKLAGCVDNVLLASQEYNLDSTGRGQSSAHMDCVRTMRSREWRYVIYQQNHDIVIKTNAEMVQIFKAMGGANDMEMARCPENANPPRCTLAEMNLGKLGICPKNLSKEDLAACEKEELVMSKGWVQVSLARETVEYLLDTLNTTGLINVLDQLPFGMDEQFVQSIAATPSLRLPGMYPARCMHENDSAAPSNHLFITRLTHWSWWKEYGCRSNIWRHWLCIFGVEDLPFLAGLHHLMVNKMMPDKDYGAIACIGELLYKRTHYALEDHPLDMSIYENLPMVRLRKGTQADPTYFDRFECPKYPQRKQKKISQVIGEFSIWR